MKIKFLGTGGAFDYELGNSAALVEIGGKRVLIDCGYTVYPRLRDLNLIPDLDYILLTHLHDDHIGSLGTTVLHHHFLEKPPRKAQLIVPDENFAKDILQSLSFCLQESEDYMDILPLSTVQGLSAINTTGRHVKGLRSYAYLFEEGENCIMYSGDLGDPDLLTDFLPKGKKCQLFHDLAFFETDGIHGYYKKLGHYLDKAQIYGYHHDARDEPTDNQIPLVEHHPEFLL